MPRKPRFTIYLLAIAILLFISLNAYGIYRKNYLENPIVNQNASAFDTDFIYNFYVVSNPNIDGRDYYGSENASITIIAYLDFTAKSSKDFIDEIFPQIESEFINTGKVKLYNKFHLTSGDLSEKNEKSQFALSLLCVQSVKRESYYPFFFDLFEIKGSQEIQTLAEKHGIPKESYQKCMKSADFKKALFDISEVENFGISGVSPRFYIGINGKSNAILEGVPKYKKFKSTIRQFSILEGD